MRDILDRNAQVYFVMYLSDDFKLIASTLATMEAEKLHDLKGGGKGPAQISETTFRVKKFQRHWKELSEMHQMQSR